NFLPAYLRLKRKTLKPIRALQSAKYSPYRAWEKYRVLKTEFKIRTRDNLWLHPFRPVDRAMMKLGQKIYKYDPIRAVKRKYINVWKRQLGNKLIEKGASWAAKQGAK